MSQPVDPDIVNQILTDPDSDLYPAQIGVFCDRCRTEEVSDFLVSDRDGRADRFEIARKHLREQGWSCTEAGDFCPTCPHPAVQGA